MRISNSNLQLSAQHGALDYQRRQESLTAWRDGANGRQQINITSSSERLHMGAGSERLTLSQAARRPPIPTPPPSPPAPQPNAGNAADDTDASVKDTGDLRFTLLRLMLEQMTGHAIAVFDSSELSADPDATPPLPDAGASNATQGSNNDRAGWGLSYNLEETHVEQESTQFSAQGIVRTADGKEIQLTLELNMSREFASQNSLSIRAGDALKDPLVVNFQGNAAQLTQTTFKFDLDADGRADTMRAVVSGSAYIALDKNGNGKIDDGRELFGALSGNGFSELAKYDDDGNGWIDENDAVFKQLLAWNGEAGTAGGKPLQTLAQLGVGALYLGNASTPFTLKDSSNALQGAIRASGLYLREDGTAGTLQQVDLVA
ncbi:hypothetical protein [Thermomonas paludicola]|uniref:hypothetical protein n=1 Tax=Thermomonas paludicola TaxID=2884874 RepID=UPI00211480BD|nr:hypothetical protein [Thermomonas paludicola]